MKQEFSYGVIPLRIYRRQWQVLLVQHHAGHWAFPKGHGNPEESPDQTAKRELFEETGLKIKQFLSNESLVESYYFHKQKELIHKRVEYFIALVKGRIVIQEEEIRAYQWLSPEEALACLTFKEARMLCQQLIKIINN